MEENKPPSDIEHIKESNLETNSNTGHDRLIEKCETNAKKKIRVIKKINKGLNDTEFNGNSVKRLANFAQFALNGPIKDKLNNDLKNLIITQKEQWNAYEAFRFINSTHKEISAASHEELLKMYDTIKKALCDVVYLYIYYMGIFRAAEEAPAVKSFLDHLDHMIREQKI